MPHVISALNVKHFLVRCLGGWGSEYFNYKGVHSLVLLAFADTDYKFIWHDITAAGSSSDSQCFPPAHSLTDNGLKVGYFILGEVPSSSKFG